MGLLCSMNQIKGHLDMVILISLAVFVRSLQDRGDLVCSATHANKENIKEADLAPIHSHLLFKALKARVPRFEINHFHSLHTSLKLHCKHFLSFLAANVFFLLDVTESQQCMSQDCLQFYQYSEHVSGISLEAEHPNFLTFESEVVPRKQCTEILSYLERKGHL